ncbi:MAG: serine hydrolase domain-containing protein [Verrucomicrobiota bacterium]
MRSSIPLLALCGGLALLPPGRADQVDDYVQAHLQQTLLPGAAVAVVHHGKVVKMAGYGLANVEQGTRVSPHTVFQIQSVTKPFVATAIMMLVEEGKLTVDQPVSECLPETPPIWKSMTVRHLLTHTSGIKDFINDPTASLRLEVTDDEVFRATAARPLEFPPGERYAYSNSNYHLLAMIVRRFTGVTYGAFLRERVFQPLGMERTRVMSWSAIIPDRAAGYIRQPDQLVNGEFIAESILAYGGGGLLSTVDDMAKWDLGLRNGRVLPSARLEQMWHPTKLNNGNSSAYGFGWGIGGTSPHRFVEHSGSHATGFSSYIVRFLDDDLSVILLINARPDNPGKLARDLAAFFVPALKPPERKSIGDLEPETTQLLRRVEEMVRAGRVEPEPFTAEMHRVLVQSLPDMSEGVRSLGSLQQLELLDRKVQDDERREYLYRGRFDSAALLIHFVRDKAGKITALWQESE